MPEVGGGVAGGVPAPVGAVQEVVPMVEAAIPMHENTKNEMQFTGKLGGAMGPLQRYRLANNAALELAPFFGQVRDGHNRYSG